LEEQKDIAEDKLPKHIGSLSLENLKKRSEEEISYIFGIILDAVDAVVKEATVKEEKVNFNVIGRLHLLPEDVRIKTNELIEFTKENDRNFINLCIMYDGQEEIVDAVKEIIKNGVKAEDINREVIKNHLYTRDFPEVDYIIRTGMDDGARISGFLLWDASYAEFKFRTDLWPDYSKEMVLEDIQDYVNRNRRKGK
jgi:undecaprenyl diphosphate synthase